MTARPLSEALSERFGCEKEVPGHRAAAPPWCDLQPAAASGAELVATPRSDLFLQSLRRICHSTCLNHVRGVSDGFGDGGGRA